MAVASRAVRADPPLLTVVLLGAAIAGAWAYVRVSLHPALLDFHAFTCATRTALAGANPYLQEPLASCEARALAAYLPAGSSGVAMPAPLPGYVFAVLAPLAVLSFAAAAALWFCVLVLALVLTTGALGRLTSLPWFVLALSVTCADGVASLTLGQLAPIGVLALVLCALALRAQRPYLAAASAAGTLLVPQVGVPVVLALFVWERRARVPVAGAVLVLAAISLAMLGLGANLEYVVRVLPAHAASEMGFVRQYALAPVLYQLGVPARVALAIAAPVAVASAAAGILLAGRLACSESDRAWIALVPSVFALLGSTFTHAHTLAFALPGALLLGARRGGGAWSAKLGLLALAIPWQPTAATVYLVPLYLLTAFALARRVWGWPLERSLFLTVLVGAVLLVEDALWLRHVATAAPAGAIVFHAAPGALAEASWQAMLAVVGSTADPATWFARACALGGLAALAGALARTRRTVRA